MLSLFLTQSACGALVCLLLVPPRAAGRAFGRFTAGLCAVLLAGGAATAPGGPGPATRSVPFFAAAALLAAVSAGLSHLGRFGAGRALLALGLAAALGGLASDAVALVPVGEAAPLTILLYIADAFTSGLAPGAALIAMILGHYYLNVPGLAIVHLQRLSLAFLVAVAARALVAAVGAARARDALAPLMALLLDAAAPPPEGSLDPFVLVLLLIHVVFGIVASGAMAFMAWRTSLIASTQSATGILYVALLMTIMGELASRYLITMTRLPL